VVKDFFLEIWERIKRLLPNPRYDDKETKYFKTIVFLIIGIIGAMILLGSLVFFVNLKGANRILVPDVTSTDTRKVDIIAAVMDLQEKGLFTNIQMKHSSKFARGYVLEQRPIAGSEVKLGRTVVLTVSMGSTIDKLGNYIGKKLSFLNLELQQAFASSDKALVEVKQPVMYVNNEAEYGVILEQKPAPGTDINENQILYLELVVSKGPAGKELEIGEFRGKSYKTAVDDLSERGIPFTFTLATESNNYGEGVVVSQAPLKGEKLPEGGVVDLTINEVKKLEKKQIFGIFEYIVSEYPMSVDIKIVAKYNNADETLLSMKHKGGRISLPYIVNDGTELVLSIFNKEVKRDFITRQQ
jgi:eukaryotic-like serine/threonine-protein kinase